MARPELRVEVAFATGPDAFDFFTLDDPVRGMLDSNELAETIEGSEVDGASGLWVNVASKSPEFATRRGRQRQLEQYNTGTATATLDNSDRRFDPSNLDGPYTLAGVSQVQPKKATRIIAVWEDETYFLFSGYAETWGVTWQDPDSSEATLTANDAFEDLANYDGLEQTEVGAGEDTGARINRVLDNAGWPDDRRAIDTGISTLQATNLSANALTEVKLAADSELGSVYVAPNGDLTFKNGIARYTEERSAVSQQTFGDDPDDPDELNYFDLVQANDPTLVRNKVQIARVGGTQQVVENVDSQAKYRTRTYNRTDLLFETDGEALDYANQVAYLFADAEPRFDSMVLKPDTNDDLWPEVLGREIGDRITVIRRPPGGGDPIVRECFIEGVSHTVSAANEWTTTFQLSNAGLAVALTLDDPIFGQLDSNILVYGGSISGGGEGYEGGYGGGY